MKYKADVNKYDRLHGRTPLSWATLENNNFELCQLLVKKGANPNVTDFHDERTPLSFAYINGNYRVCQLLLNAGSTCDGLYETAIAKLFSWAKQQEDIKMCKQLIEANDELDWSHFVPQILEMKHLQKDQAYKQFALYDAYTNQDYQTIERLLDDDETDINLLDNHYQSPLHIMARAGNLELVKKMVVKGADLDQKDVKGNTPVCLAAMKGHHKICEELIMNQANLNIPNDESKAPLYYICQEGHVEFAETLLRNGANMNSNGCLNVALEFYYTNVAELLLRLGVNVNKASNDGITPLMCAAKTSSSEAVSLLLSKGADPNICEENFDGNSLNALACAITTGNKEIIEILCKLTTNPDGFNTCIVELAKANLDIDGELKTFLSKAFASNRVKFALEKSSFYGNAKLLQFVLQQNPNILFKSKVPKIMENVIKSDSKETCEILLQHCKETKYMIQKKDKEICKKLILERGNSDIIKLFGYEVEKKENNFKILESIPKSTDFSYTNIMKKILPLGKPSYNN